MMNGVFEAEDELPTEKVIRAVAAYSNRDPKELPPLQRTIDTDSLNQLFSDTEATSRNSGAVSFRYVEFEVTVHADGTVDVTPPKPNDVRS